MATYKRPTPKPGVPSKPTKRDSVMPESVKLVRGKGTNERGGGPGGEYWQIEVDGKRAGIVFINLIDEPPIGRHASIQIFLNQPSQGRKIGRVAYRKACEECSYDVIYAHMRKSNIASRKAAEAAGFKVDDHLEVSQLAMVWRRSG